MQPHDTKYQRAGLAAKKHFDSTLKCCRILYIILALNRRFQHVLELVEAKVKLFQKKFKTVSNYSKQNYNADENHKGRREVSFLTFHTNTSES